MKVIEQTYTGKKQGKSNSSCIEIDEQPTPESVEGMCPELGEDSPRSEDGLRVSEEEYWGKYYNHPDFSYEWNNGILEEKPMADYWSSKVYRWFLKVLEEYLEVFPIAKLICLEIGFRLVLPEKTAIRKPDMALILHTNPIDIDDEDCTYQGIFDMCIEFLSDSTLQEVKRDTVVKKSEYCQAGVKEYLILDRKGKETAFYRLNNRGSYAPIPQSGGIMRSDVLPGFQFRIEDLYSYPSLKCLTNDEVYKAFVLKERQEERQELEKQVEAERQRADVGERKIKEERQRADAAEKRAEVERQEKLKERQRADAADRRAEELIAKLRALGIEP
jgi:Uma2 family endonuclease